MRLAGLAVRDADQGEWVEVRWTKCRPMSGYVTGLTVMFDRCDS